MWGLERQNCSLVLRIKVIEQICLLREAFSVHHAVKEGFREVLKSISVSSGLEIKVSGIYGARLESVNISISIICHSKR